VRSEIQNAIQLLRSGRPESTDAALAILQNTIFSFSMKVCGHREDAEDTMQETLLRAFETASKSWISLVSCVTDFPPELL